ncbi:MAG: ribonuclease PH [Oscillatoriales cyanobacterium SM2_2_1]|nr:ribonuclease PH [Oscillatoriales cyanobacterium SM2_2_1]
MAETRLRADGRMADQLRPVRLVKEFMPHPLGSVLIGFGATQVLCTVAVELGIPKWQQPNRGWLTAEYRLLPAATQPRQSLRPSGRSEEIQRLIGRSLRASVDLEKMPGITLVVDVDVLQADGGTRTAGITGGYGALVLAVQRLLSTGVLTVSPLQRAIAAVSVGLVDGEPILDLNYLEDVAASVDLNVVMDQQLNLVELQGTAEAEPFSRSQLNRMLDLAEKGISELFTHQPSP